MAFTEQGVAMLSSVLNSKRAIQVNIQIIRTFTKLRHALLDNENLRKELVKIVDGDKRAEVCRASLNQSPISDAAAVIVFCAIYERTMVKYGERGIRYVFIEVGHAVQNIYLQAVSLKLGTLVIGAFNDNDLKKIMRFDLYEYPLCIMPVGKLSSE